MLRGMLLGAAKHRGLQRFITRHGRAFGAYRFVAGETLDEFMRVVRATNDRGFPVAAGLLGENVTSREGANGATREYELLLARLARDRADVNVAPWLTQLGLAIDGELALANATSIVEAANEHENFVRIVMEQSTYTDAILTTYRRLRERGHANVGTVLQAYLYRSAADLRALLDLKPNLRLVKGAYLEPASIAFPKKRDVDRNFVRLIELSLRDGGFTAIATHDEAIIEHAIGFIQAHGVRGDAFEFQMLYGVRPKLQAALAKRGYRVRLAVPFGPQWYPYFMRRLAERPANVLFLLSSMWKG